MDMWGGPRGGERGDDLACCPLFGAPGGGAPSTHAPNRNNVAHQSRLASPRRGWWCPTHPAAHPANIDVNARNVEGVVYKMGNLYTDGERVHHAGNYGELVHRLVHHLYKFRDASGYTALGFTALMYAAANGHVDVVRLLLEWGADIMVRSHDWQARPGKTALYWAQLMGRYDVSRLLLKHHGHGGPRKTIKKTRIEKQTRPRRPS